MEVEARRGIEPLNEGFANLSLTTWVPRLGTLSRADISVAKEGIS
jgi:hypothetical protein